MRVFSALVLATALVVGAVVMSASPVAAASEPCPKELTSQLGLQRFGSPRFAGLDQSVFVVKQVMRPRAGRFCLVDIWTVPETGWYTQRYVVVVNVRTRVITQAYLVDTLAPAAPHDWVPSDYRGIVIPEDAVFTMMFQMSCEGRSVITPRAAALLVQRLVGYVPANTFCGG